MHRRRDEMRWPFAGQLDDELTEIGLRHFQSRRFEGRIKVYLLRGHRLRFNDAPAVRLPGNVENDVPRILRVAGPVNVTATFVDGRFQLFEIAIEMREGVFLDAFGVIAERINVRQGRVATTIASQ